MSICKRRLSAAVASARARHLLLAEKRQIFLAAESSEHKRRLRQLSDVESRVKTAETETRVEADGWKTCNAAQFAARAAGAPPYPAAVAAASAAQIETFD